MTTRYPAFLSRRPLVTLLVLLGSALPAACSGPRAAEGEAPLAGTDAPTIAVRDTIVESVLEAAGTAGPYAQATLSTRLMGTVLEVAVREGDAVAAGTVLLRVDARDLDARRAQLNAQLAEAHAVQAEARINAERIRRLFADSVATRAQLDAVETGQARADAAVRLAEAGLAELEATAEYAVVRAPFAGVITQRQVDPGAFAAPGAPLLTIEDGSRLRVTASVAPEAVRGLRRGQRLEARIEGRLAPAVIEGIVPVPGGATYQVNAVVANPARAFLPHSAGVLLVPLGRRPVRVVHATAVIRDGDLTGVRVAGTGPAELRWIRTGRAIGADVEVLSGLTAGERVLAAPGGAR